MATSLDDEIEKLRDTAISSLNEVHDYFANSKRVWRVVQLQIAQGRKFEFQNPVTGNTVAGGELSELAQEYITGYLASSTFQHFVSLLEDFIFDLFRVWLTQYPENLESRQLKFQTVLASADISEIIRTVVEKEVVAISYGKISDWFKHLGSWGIDCPDQDQIDRLAEIKASRDILVHNNGVANALYVSKSKGHARFTDDERLEIPEPYHRESWELIKQVVTDVADAAIDKAQ